MLDLPEEARKNLVLIALATGEAGVQVPQTAAAVWRLAISAVSRIGDDLVCHVIDDDRTLEIGD
jgi:hypothetical protein